MQRSVSGRRYNLLKVIVSEVLAKVTAGQRFSLLLSLFLSLFYCHTIIPEIDIFYKYQSHQLLSRKTASLSQAGRSYLFGRYYVYSRDQFPSPANPLSLITSSSVTSQVKVFCVPNVEDPLSISVLSESTDSAIFWISKSFKNSTGYSKKLAREL